MQTKELPVGHFGRLKDGPVVLNLGLLGPGAPSPSLYILATGAYASTELSAECSDVTPQVRALLDDLDRTPPDADEYLLDVASLAAATLEGAENVPEFTSMLPEFTDDLGGRLGLYQLCSTVATYLDKYRRHFETDDYPGVFSYEVPTRFWRAWCEETDQMFRREWLETRGHLASQTWPAGATSDRTSDSVLERIARTVVKRWFHPMCEWLVVLNKTEIHYVLAASFKEAYRMAAQRWDIDSVTSIEKKS